MANGRRGQMIATTDVTLKTAASRRVVRYALWRIVATNVIGEHERPLSDALYDRAWQEIHPVYGVGTDAGEAEFRLLRLAGITATARAVSAASDGSRLALPVSAAEFAGALEDGVRALEDNDNLFWNLGPGDRETVRACRAEALRLLDDVLTASAPDDRPVAVPEFPGPVRASRRQSLADRLERVR
jgi:hypothetical protein